MIFTQGRKVSQPPKAGCFFFLNRTFPAFFMNYYLISVFSLRLDSGAKYRLKGKMDGICSDGILTEEMEDLPADLKYSKNFRILIEVNMIN